MNPWLENYGRDRFTHKPEMTFTSAAHYAQTEAAYAHGYPATSWIQLAFIYAAGIYTAKEQGIVKRGVYFQRFWRAHYFDWLLFARRAGIYGVAGGFVFGTFWFGNVKLSLRRIYSKYQYYMQMEKQEKRGVTRLYFPIQN